MLRLRLQQLSTIPFYCFLLLNFILFHDIYHQDGDGCDRFECGHRLPVSPMLTVLLIDAQTTNSNDTTAMIALRNSFNNFNGSNWNVSGDPCGSPRKR
jgi:hypothetical protein